MMTLFLAAAILAPSDTKLTCAVMSGNPAKDGAPAVEYNGMRFGMCCGGCDASFKKEPAKYLKMATEKGTVIGVSLFDPVSGVRVNEPKITADYKGIRYSFANAEDKAKFEKAPAKFAATPSKSVLTCAVSGEKISSYSAAAGYVDYNGTRYYSCCADCLPAMQKDIANLSKKVAGKAEAPVAMDAKNEKSHGHGG